jgi:L,D-transpeptidase YcbB
MLHGTEAFRCTLRGTREAFGIRNARTAVSVVALLALWPLAAGAQTTPQLRPNSEVASQAESNAERSPSSEAAAAADASRPASPSASAVKSEEAAPTASSPAASAAATPAIPEINPIIAATRRLLAASNARGKITANDRTAVIAFYEAATQPIWTTSNALSKRGQGVIDEIRRAGDWGLDPAAFELPQMPLAATTPDDMAAIEAQISFAVLQYARHARGGRVDPTTISALIDMKPRLLEPRSVLDGISTSELPDVYLTTLHPSHDGFTRLRKALVDLRRGGGQAPATDVAEEDTKADRKGGAKSAAKPKRALSRTETEQRIVVNMERWRWMPEKLGVFHVLDNVPEQVTRVVRDGKVVLQEKIVVGKPNTPTPSFSADMKYVIFHPTWGVPEGIKTNELGPMLRRASANGGGGGWFFGGGGSDGGASRALARHDLRVAHNGREVNPDNIDWSRVDIRQFQFVQPPGGRNVLGVVKFRFPNKHDVYMHDTPEKHLFSQSSRAYSHGCMRVQNPMRLAETILAYDKGWSASRVQGILGQSGPIDITLEKSVPVHITYFTATSDEQGNLELHGDLYGLDSRVASALAGRPAPLAASRPEVEPQASQPRHKQRSRVADEAPQPPRERFDPFSISAN